MIAIADGPPRSPAPHIIEADEQAVLPLERRWLKEDERVMTADGIRQLIEAGLREGRALGERRFGIADEEGKRPR